MSMAAVVLVHSITGAYGLLGMTSMDSFTMGLIQLFKFGTIGFFLISGFLMSEGLDRRPPLEYLKRRLQRVAMPWLVWSSIFCAMRLIYYLESRRIILRSSPGSVLLVLNNVYVSLFQSTYWFIPNLLIALSILLLCRRFLMDLRLGALFLALSLFYGLNIYAQWIPIQHHTEALFGFVFYLWLGTWGARNIDAVEAWIARTSMPALTVLALLAWMAAQRESEVLAAAGSTDPMNTLRIGNQLYSVAVVLLVFKMRKAVWPRMVDVRANTFGIYLTHGIVLGLLVNIARRTITTAVATNASSAPPALLACLSLCIFAITYGCSLVLTRWLLDRSSLRWTVGAAPVSGKPQLKREFTTSLSPTC